MQSTKINCRSLSHHFHIKRLVKFTALVCSHKVQRVQKRFEQLCISSHCVQFDRLFYGVATGYNKQLLLQVSKLISHFDFDN